MIADLAALLAVPLAVTAIFIGVHTYLGLHVLRRRVVFADLALAQLSALGATLAVALGHAPSDLAAFAYAMLFAFSGAVALTASRSVSWAVSQEALVGVLYVAASAATVLVIDRAPQGAEHVKRMLVGTLLDARPEQLAKIVPLYSAVALLHWAARRPLLDASENRLTGARGVLWDFVFYASFGAIVTSSVAVAGVLLVFSFLIIPAVTGTLFAADRIGLALLIGWCVGLTASLGGFASSLAFDLPTGACVVLTLFAALGLAALARFLWIGDPNETTQRRARARQASSIGLLSLMLAGSLWSFIRPGADQPLLAALNRIGLRPERFMDDAEAARYAEAAAMERRYRAEVEALSNQERQSRWRGAGLTDDEVRRIASYQQTYNEMARGERFVQDHLLARAHARERWQVSLPLAVVSAAALLVLVFRTRVMRRPTRTPSDGAGEPLDDATRKPPLTGSLNAFRWSKKSL
ncbi:ABC-3 protein [Methylobacterium sp. 4-46]|uniref:metal ABC transporter permease n=1 Tax=unclassified Methylobacterium TaxID=2615210 RepID=UPI000152CF1F|nr:MULTISPECIES: metal ABC transporter permease [Methylobacterium]ACA17219.1 ABC-3 protein [Methylobacterium sp. 4-46]WFT82901.1 metal ABC transporter permease [Methylobacterium nodulans]